jgi:hypothetical protein
VVGWIDDVNDADADELAEELREKVLKRLVDFGLQYERAHQQRRGAFVLVQGGSVEEVADFEELLAEELTAMRERVSQARGGEGLEMRSYTINSECGVMRIKKVASVEEAKDIYSRERGYDFNGALKDEYPGSWFFIVDETGQRVEDFTRDMPR